MYTNTDKQDSEVQRMAESSWMNSKDRMRGNISDTGAGQKSLSEK